MSMKFKKETKDKLADLEARVEALEESDSEEQNGDSIWQKKRKQLLKKLKKQNSCLSMNYPSKSKGTEEIYTNTSVPVNYRNKNNKDVIDNVDQCR